MIDINVILSTIEQVHTLNENQTVYVGKPATAFFKEYVLEHDNDFYEPLSGRIDVDAFVNKDLELARWVINRDDVVDDLFDSFRKELIQKINENVKNGEMATDMLMVAKYFERIGDHATNIAEWVIYSITGKHEDE